MLFILLFTTTADAHHPEVTASPYCDGSVLVTATAWTTADPTHRVNNDILISLDPPSATGATGASAVIGSGSSGTGSGPTGNVSTTGSFNAENNYTFSVMFYHVSLGTHTVRATAVVGWGANEEFGFAGDFREVSVTVTGPCTDTVITTTTDTPQAPLESIPTILTPTTTVVETPVATPVEDTPKFTG
jgi:hypothetical protein